MTLIEITKQRKEYAARIEENAEVIPSMEAAITNKLFKVVSFNLDETKTDKPLVIEIALKDGTTKRLAYSGETIRDEAYSSFNFFLEKCRALDVGDKARYNELIDLETAELQKLKITE